MAETISFVWVPSPGQNPVYWDLLLKTPTGDTTFLCGWLVTGIDHDYVGFFWNDLDNSRKVYCNNVTLSRAKRIVEKHLVELLERQ